jgi:predicted RNA-binding Zn ribbon-like protein
MVTETPAGEDFLLELLNNAPVVDGVQALGVPPQRELAVRAILTWDALARDMPGRLRPCSNGECRLFVLDGSKANAARWCSMAACGNRIKARRHYQRTRTAREMQVALPRHSRRVP